MKRRLAALIVAVGSVAGAAALWRRRSGAGKDRVDVYFADGSMVPGALPAERLEERVRESGRRGEEDGGGEEVTTDNHFRDPTKGVRP